MHKEASDDLDAYMKCWKAALNALLGWSPEKTEAWGRRWRPSEEHMPLSCERAMHYISPLLVPRRLKQPGALRNESLVQFEGRIQDTIDHGFPSPGDMELKSVDRKFAPGEWLRLLDIHRQQQVEAGNWLSEAEPEKYDWNAARLRVNTILGQYGESLHEANQSE
jgi:hypothetical protein